MVPLPFAIHLTLVALRPGHPWEGWQAQEGGSLSGKRGQPLSHKHACLFIPRSDSLSCLWKGGSLAAGEQTLRTWQGGGGLPRLCPPRSGSCKVQQSRPGWGSDCSCVCSWSHPWCWEQRLSHGAAAQEPSLRLLPAKGQLQLYDFTSWVTLCSRCNAITVTDVSAITARAA